MRIVIALLATLALALPAPVEAEPSRAEAAPPAPAAAEPSRTEAAPAAPVAAEPASAESVPEDGVQAERAAVEDDGYAVRLSMPTEDDRTAWQQPGLRIELAIGRGVLAGDGPAPRIDLLSFMLRPRLRIDRFWSLGGSFAYSIADGDFTGLRWTAMIEPVFHPASAWGLSLGLGYGGLAVTRTGASVSSGATQEIATRTLRSDERLASCAGGAWVSQARAEYLAVVGPLFSTGPYLLGDAQWTGCTEDFGSTDRETGQPAFGRQWWLHLGGTVGWWLSWR